MSEYIYPANAELQEIAQSKLPRLTTQRRIFDILPIVSVDASVLMWEQKDDYKGLQQVRGLSGAPGRVKAVGGKRYMAQPGVYGEYATIDELELTTRRRYGTFSTPIDVTDLVMEKQDQLLQRRLDRIEAIGWTLLTTGTFSVSNGAGVSHTDSYTFQTYDATTWATVATATPLLDFRAVKLLGRGYSTSFGSSARAYMNQGTLNNLINNTNAADVGGRRQGGFIPTTADFQGILLADDLPQIVVIEDGYFNDAGTWVKFMADGKVLVVGARGNGDPVGDYALTRNANNPDMAPGAYMRVVDEPDRVPRNLEVHDGHNGGPRLYYPSSVVIMDVS